MFASNPVETIRTITRRGSIDELANNLLQRRFDKAKKFHVTVHGLKLFLNPEDRNISPIISVLGLYEPLVTSAFVRILQPGDTVVDVGANIGWYTILSAGIVGERGRVVSFEPETRNYSYLCQSVDEGALHMVEVRQEALWNVQGNMVLHLSGAGLHSISRPSQGGTMNVRTNTLDNSFDSSFRVKLLKVDVEGGERQVVEGGLNMIESGRIENIIMEWNLDSWEGNHDLLKRLSSLFDCYRLTGIHQNYAWSNPFARKPIDLATLNRSGGNLLLKRKQGASSKRPI